MNEIIQDDPEFISSFKLAELIDLGHASVKRCMSAFQRRGDIDFNRVTKTVDTPDGGQKSIETYIIKAEDALAITLHLNPDAKNKLQKYWQDNGVSIQYQNFAPGTFEHAFTSNDNTFSIRQMALTLNVNERPFIAWLIEQGYVYRANRKGKPLTPHFEKIKSGLMISASERVAGFVGMQARFTTEGFLFVANHWCKHVNEDL